MVDQKFESLVDLLINMTTSSLINWQATSDNDRFIFTVSNVTVELSTEYDEQTEEKYIIVNLRNDGGDIIDKFFVGSTDNKYEVMEDMLNRARRKANNVDDIIDKLISKLLATKLANDKKDEEDLPF